LAGNVSPVYALNHGGILAIPHGADLEVDMTTGRQTNLGSVVALWRYPVKSMMGEELNAADVTESGLLGDRAYALIDSADGKVVSAKNPRKWPQLFDFRAAFVDGPRASGKLPSVRITLPDGSIVTNEQEDINEILSHALKRQVAFAAAEVEHPEIAASSSANAWAPAAEEYWPDLESLDFRDTVTDFELPKGTFFDCAVVHVLTTATLDRLRELYPAGRFEVRRFRPNIVLETEKGSADFVENG
jgi:uncharacterized protein YcbX